MLLKQRLKNVTDVMESTREQQMSILDDAIAQEETMAKCMESHAQMVSDSLLYEKEMQAAKEGMMEMLERSFNQANEKRLERFKTASSHGKSLSSMNASRHNVLSCAQTVTSNVIGALEKDLNLDTLSMEVSKLVLERKRIRENGAEELPKSNIDEEVRDKPVRDKPEEVDEKGNSAEQSSPQESESIEVVPVSPKKKSMSTVVLGDSLTVIKDDVVETVNP